MDWLENFVPFVRLLDGGDGALEVALVLLVAAAVGTVFYRAWLRGGGVSWRGRGRS